jgi:putative transposase
MCGPLGVTRGGYYRHLNKAVYYDHLEIIEAVQELAKASDHTYGSLRMKAALGVMSYPVRRNKAKKLRKEAGVLVKRRKKVDFIWLRLSTYIHGVLLAGAWAQE